jgi:hypothetical protein
MNQKIQFTIGGLILALVLIGGGYYIYQDSRSGADGGHEHETATTSPNGEATSTAASTSGTTTPLKSPATSSASRPAAGQNGTVLPASPSLSKTVTVTVMLDPAVRASVLAEISHLRSVLGKTPSSVTDWNKLGSQFKLVGDYAQAEAAWKYAVVLAPQNRTALYSLGDLYHYYLKNYTAARDMYLKSIAADPLYIPPYIALDELYATRLNNPTAGGAILEKGLGVNPGNIILLLPAARRFAAIDKIKARHYYEQALEKAQSLNDAALEATIRAELKAL